MFTVVSRSRISHKLLPVSFVQSKRQLSTAGATLPLQSAKLLFKTWNDWAQLGLQSAKPMMSRQALEILERLRQGDRNRKVESKEWLCVVAELLQLNVEYVFGWSNTDRENFNLFRRLWACRHVNLLPASFKTEGDWAMPCFVPVNFMLSVGVSSSSSSSSSW